MKEPNIQVIYHETPSVAVLSACESQSFFATLLACIKKTSEEERNNAV